MATEKNDHMIMEVVHGHTGPTMRVTKPSDVLRIHEKGELEAQLQHYNRPFINHVVQPNNARNRKWYVEKIRPALRYYCTKYGIKIPEWLENENYYHGLPEHEKLDMFGTSTLSRREFRPMVKAPTRDASQ